MRLFTFFRLCAFIAVLLFVSCKKEENFTSRITFVNALIESPATSILTLKADSQVIASGIKYDSLFTNPAVASGTFNISIFSGTVEKLQFLTNLQAAETYTWVMYDSAVKGKLYVCKDVLPSKPGGAQCYVRVFNLIDSTSGLYVANDTNRVYLSSLRFAFADFKTSSTGPAFTLTDTITRPSIRIDSSRYVARVLQPLLPGKIYSLFLVGSISDTGRNRLHTPKIIMQVHN